MTRLATKPKSKLTSKSKPQPRQSLEDVLDSLGNVPLSRIRFPLGNSTEADVVDILDRGESMPCELIDGVLVEKAMGFAESMVAARIVRHLGNFVDPNGLGIVTCADGATRLRLGLVRMPDVGFVARSRFPKEGISTDAISKVVPDLAVEVISKSNTPKEMDRKLRDYFEAGVRLVWCVYPKERKAIAYTSPTRKKEVGTDGVLDGGKVLPGFELPLREVFAVLDLGAEDTP